MNLFMQGYDEKDMLKFYMWLFEGDAMWATWDAEKQDEYVKMICGVGFAEVTMESNRCVAKWVKEYEEEKEAGFDSANVSWVELLMNGYTQEDMMEFFQWVFEGDENWMLIDETEADKFI